MSTLKTAIQNNRQKDLLRTRENTLRQFGISEDINSVMRDIEAMRVMKENINALIGTLQTAFETWERKYNATALSAERKIENLIQNARSDIAVAVEYAKSIEAEKGDAGLQGEHGLQGERGIQGERGLQGSIGERGLQGERGPQGEHGRDGQAGKDGKTPQKGIDYFKADEVTAIEGKASQTAISKLKELEEWLDISAIKGLKEQLQTIRQSARGKTKGGGSMGNTQHEIFSISAGTTAITVAFSIAGGGNAIFKAAYQGQILDKDAHYTVGSDFRTLTFVAAVRTQFINNTVFSITYIRG